MIITRTSSLMKMKQAIETIFDYCKPLGNNHLPINVAQLLNTNNCKSS